MPESLIWLVVTIALILAVAGAAEYAGRMVRAMRYRRRVHRRFRR
ncbi:MAG: hypothetical protein ACE5IZ_01175 [Dehalococcoidia bacterium]